MKMLEKNTKYPLSEIIAWAKEVYLKYGGNEGRDLVYFDLYSEIDDDEGLKANESYYFADGPEFLDDDTDEETFPEIYYEKNLSFVYGGQLFMEVIFVAYDQKAEETTLEDYVKSLNFYYERDCFLDFFDEKYNY